MQTFRHHAGCLFVFVLYLLTLLTMPAFAQQKGKASYYSKRANGAQTSSGIRLNNDSLVCAHKTHPFGTKLLVKNPANGKECIVTVIDRGPHGRGRIIDLSYEAARRLGIILQGVALVEVSVYDENKNPLSRPSYELPELDIEIPAQRDPHDLTPEWQKPRVDSTKAPQKNNYKKE